MKPGVKRDLILISVFVVGMLLWFGVGFILAPSVPPAAPGNEVERLQAVESLKAFMHQWGQKGLYLGLALIFLCCGLRAFRGKERPANAPQEKPDDRSLPPAVGWGILLGVLMLGVAALVWSAMRK
jgi:hypothetical protein